MRRSTDPIWKLFVGNGSEKREVRRLLEKLMDATYDRRRHRIVNQEPPVAQILDKFPPLTNHVFTKACAHK